MSLISSQRGTKRKLDMDDMDETSRSPAPSLKQSMITLGQIGSTLWQSFASAWTAASPSSGAKRIALDADQLHMPGGFDLSPEPEIPDRQGPARTVPDSARSPDRSLVRREVYQTPARQSTNNDDFWNGVGQETGIQSAGLPNLGPSPHRPTPNRSQRRKSRQSPLQKRIAARPVIVSAKTPDQPKPDEDSVDQLERKVKEVFARYLRAKTLASPRGASRVHLAGGKQSSPEDPRRSRKLQEKAATLKALSEARSLREGAIDPDLDELIRRTCEQLLLDLDLRLQGQEEGVKPEPTPLPPKPFIKPLSTETLARIPSVDEMRKHPGKQVALFNRNPVLHADLLKVLPASLGATDATGAPADWLNDNAINAFFDALCIAARAKLDEKLKRDGAPLRDHVPRFHAFNTIWRTTMMKPKGYENLRNWAKRAKCGGKDLLSVERLFIPIHLGSHWALAILRPAERQVWAYDSMNSPSTLDGVLALVRQYLQGELGTHWQPEEWRFERGESGTQTNMNDCGVYTCFNAFASFYGEPAQLLGSRDLGEARMAMAAMLLSGGFVGEFDLETYHDGLALMRETEATNGVEVNGVHD